MAAAGVLAAAPAPEGTTARVVEESTVETRKVYEVDVLPKPPGPRKVAIFVKNRAGEKLDDRTQVLEDLLASRLASRKFNILSRDVVLNALKPFPGDMLDKTLDDSTSALRLAQSMGADMVLVPTITSYDVDVRDYQGNGISTRNVTHILKVGYRIAEGAEGGMVAGDTVTVSRMIRQSEGLHVSTDPINQLLEDAADQLADKLAKKAPALPETAPLAENVNIKVACTVADFAKLPNVWLNEKNEVVLGPGNADLQAMDVTVELNGLTLGSAPGTFKVPPGLNKIRLSRVGFKNYERTINTYDGMKLVVPMQMTDEGYAHWKEIVTFFTALENNRKLTDAEVKIMEGYAQELRQSGFRVDVKVDDTRKGLTYYLKRLLF